MCVCACVCAYVRGWGLLKISFDVKHVNTLFYHDYPTFNICCWQQWVVTLHAATLFDICEYSYYINHTYVSGGGSEMPGVLI